MRRADRTGWSVRRITTGVVCALWLAGIAASVASHDSTGSQQLLRIAFAASMVWFVLRHPRLVLGLCTTSLVVMLTFFASPRPPRR
jgi:hypothetical protein